MTPDGLTRQSLLVRDWHDAINTRDIERMRSLVTPDVVIGGPRGNAVGADVMCEWVERAGIELQPTEIVEEGDLLVVAQAARWRDAESGELGEIHNVASVFEIFNDRIRRVERLESMNAALVAAGFRPRDAVR